MKCFLKAAARIAMAAILAFVLVDGVLMRLL